MKDLFSIGARVTRGTLTAYWIVILAAAGSLAGCAERIESRVALTSAAPETSFPNAIARARAASERAASMRVPTAEDFAAASDESIAKALQGWATSRRDATQAAHRAYADALRVAGGPEDEAQAYGEIAALWLRLEDDTRAALFASIPAQYRDDPSLVGAVQGATVYALRPLLERIESNVGACRRIAAEAPSAARACAEVAERFEASRDPLVADRHPVRLASSAPPAPAVAEPARPVVPTTRPKPCMFRGTVAARGAVYESETGGAVVLPLSASAPIEVSSLAVSNAPGGRYKVSVTWPRVVEGYLQAEDAPFVLTRKVDADDAIWASEGDRVSASNALGPTVRVSRSANDARSVSATSERRLFCHDLELATTPGTAFVAPGRGTQ